ncbi:MAG TPA: hypothetical protein VF188_14670 [Longimicrobiales bacterium]
MREQRRRRARAEIRNEPRGEDRSLEALRAEQLGQTPGYEARGQVGRPADGVLVQVCLECGRECTFDQEPPPAELTCPKCGNTVFRSFFAVKGYDDVEADFRASTERDLASNDTESDVTESDVLDLNNL